MSISLRHSIQTADIIIISRNGQGVSYIIPADLVILLLLFLSSTTAQVLALLALSLAGRLYQSWLWLTDWPAWLAGWRVVMADFRRVGGLMFEIKKPRLGGLSFVDRWLIPAIIMEVSDVH